MGISFTLISQARTRSKTIIGLADCAVSQLEIKGQHRAECKRIAVGPLQFEAWLTAWRRNLGRVDRSPRQPGINAPN